MIRTVGIVSLSSGILGESFIRFESDIGIRRLKEYGLNVKFMPHALMGMDISKRTRKNEPRIYCKHFVIRRSI